VLAQLLCIRKFSPGPDGIPGHIFKCYAHQLAPILLHIYNLTLLTSLVPEQWKRANVVPIKKRNGDYRPISLLPIAAKVLEKLMVKHVIMPKVDRDLLDDQYAFVPGAKGGTTIALTVIRLWILRRLDQGPGFVRMLMVDFTKAFDRICHNKLLWKMLSRFHMPPAVVRWVSSYLTDRRQRVLISNAQFTSWKAIASGVPQGSVLGPLLFALLASGFIPNSINSTVVMYADDMTILHHVTATSGDHTQNELCCLQRWADDNSLTINPAKTKVLDVGNITAALRGPIQLGTIDVEVVTTAKLLGIYFTSNLKWDNHFENVGRLCRQSMRCLSVLRKFGVSGNDLWTIYLTLVFCHMAYAWPAVCDATQSAIRPLESIERYAARICDHTITVPLRTRLDNISRRLFHDVERSPNHPLRSFFNETCARNRRRKQILAPPRCKTERYKRSFIHFAS